MSKRYTPAIFQATVRPSWVGILSYISKEEQAAILQAILKYPNKTDINSKFWEDTIEPDLKAQYDIFTKSNIEKGRASRDYWNNKKGEDKEKISLPDDEEMDNSCLEKGKDMDNISLPSGNLSKDKDKDKDKSKDKDKDNNTKRFIKPTFDEISAYCTENNFRIDIQAFMDFYESKGWKVGVSPMKDWKATLRNWWRRDRNNGGKENAGIDYNKNPDEGKYAGFGRKI